MCVVIDVNVFPSVFKENSADHDQFIPLHEWIINGSAKMVYGGTTYNQQLRELPKYSRYLGELERNHKLEKLDDIAVDTYEKQIMNALGNTSCNDAHIIAIVIESKCSVVCSKDTSSFPYIKQANLYPKGVRRPSIYSENTNGHRLLNHRSRRYNCGPCCR